MTNDFNESFTKSLHKGFLDKTILSESKYTPKLLTNKEIPKEKVLSTILQELDTCTEFYISVAFVTTSGIAVLFNSLLALEKRNIKGKVLVSQYLDFTQPEALKKLMTFRNIELKISTKDNTHSKGYIFKKDHYYNIIIGSSNLTSNALTINKEWNLKISGLHSSDIVDNVLNEFYVDFEKADWVTEEYIRNYEKTYALKRLSRLSVITEFSNKEISPNAMQKVALDNLKKLRLGNQKKALIISATGTGKTYLSAFDVKNFNPKRILFVVHRLNIAIEAKKTFENLFGDSKTFGLFSGDHRDINVDFIFSTVQTISKEENLTIFKKDHFDYIIIDESHRSGGNSYLQLLEYFSPKFLLGMTATPERTDGFDIFSLFDHNIAYEIRLHTAMKEGMLSDFHYYGISDLIINDKKRDESRDFNFLNNDDRVEKIIYNAKKFGCDNGIVRGLVFCSNNVESDYFSKKFNESGFKTIALSGNSSEEQRLDAISRLESDDNNTRLDYIFTVDIFNEGIDIPKVNQILMIRPTESAIIFVQQLGRGLRKSESKDFLTIVDFIGNYQNNYLIPIALYGDTSYNKDTLRKLISEGSKNLPGTSTINFDEISKEQIYDSIAKTNMSLLNDLKKDYQLLKFRLGRMPMMIDFLQHESRDPFQFVLYSKKSYYHFVLKVDDSFDTLLDEESLDLLVLFSKEINNGKRVEESYLLKQLIKLGEVSIDLFIDSIYNDFGYVVSQETIKSIIQNINFDFIKSPKKIVVKNGTSILFHPEFSKRLDESVFKVFFADTIEYSIQTFKNTYTHDKYKDGLILYNKYSRRDVCRLLNWNIDVSTTIYGYMTKNEITPCFVTYHKSENIEETIKYNDHFINPSVFAWESRNNRKLDSGEIKNVIESKRILLFVKKEDAEGTDFYFMGDVKIVDGSVEQVLNPNSGNPIVHFKFQLEEPVEDELYEYITAVRHEEKKVDSLQIREDASIFSIPLYDFYAAAGTFSELQDEKNFTAIEVEEKYTKDDKYFACKVIGESMNKRIPNGSICLFKKYEGGTRNGKIVLVENRDIQDPDFNSAFTIKTYSSQKSVTEEGWEHIEIVLKPNSYDQHYTDIIIDADKANNMFVVGEFIKVLN